MRKALTEEEKYRQMMEEPVNTLIPRLALPSMVSMVVVAVYNMADFRVRCGWDCVFHGCDYSGGCFYDRNGLRE